jgi:hypothetical protein
MTTVVEKASTSLGIIVFKCLAVDPRVEDYDEDIADAESVEKAFYEFMANQPEEPVDINHKEKLAGKIVAGWYFPEENVFRVAFKPNDLSIVQKAANGDFEGSSFAAVVHREPLYDW